MNKPKESTTIMKVIETYECDVHKWSGLGGVCPQCEKDKLPDVKFGGGRPGICTACKEPHELHPAGVGGAFVCLVCARRNPAALRRYAERRLGIKIQ